MAILIRRAIDHHPDPDSKRQPRTLARAGPKQDRAGTLLLAAESDNLHQIQAASANRRAVLLRRRLATDACEVTWSETKVATMVSNQCGYQGLKPNLVPWSENRFGTMSRNKCRTIVSSSLTLARVPGRCCFNNDNNNNNDNSDNNNNDNHNKTDDNDNNYNT